MKFSVKLPAKSVMLASAFIFCASAVVHAHDKDTMDIPPGDMEPGIAGRASAYDNEQDRQGNRDDKDRGSPQNSPSSTDDRDVHDKKDLYRGSGTEGTGPKLPELESRY